MFGARVIRRAASPEKAGRKRKFEPLKGAAGGAAEADLTDKKANLIDVGGKMSYNWWGFYGRRRFIAIFGRRRAGPRGRGRDMSAVHESYRSPLEGRYASEAMKKLFSDRFKFSTWRRLWLILARAERELGLDITEEQIAELAGHLDDIDFEAAAAYEHELKHDVMAHVHAYGDQCPLARPIIHLGATSCYVGDNTDIIIMAKALDIIERRLLDAIRALAGFAERYKGTPTLGYTHLQPAQPTTVGKRAALWLNDLLSDLEDLRYLRGTIKPLGSKGATGTQASFLQLVEGDEDKVLRLDGIIARELGFDRCVDVSGQTYSRKTDSRVLGLLAGIAQSASKFGNDIRLLQHMRELYEPFGKSQIGSSAMPYKRNPMMCERMTSLARYVIADSINPMMTAAAQWLERTLDDSANRRISVSEAFLATDAVLLIYSNVAGGLRADEGAIADNLGRELPFMAAETILMDCVKRGLDRQDTHERIRRHTFEALQSGKNLLDIIAGDEAFGLSPGDIAALADPAAFTGMAAAQTENFLKSRIEPVLKGYTPEEEDTEIKI
jgi:adenylosuccinate lyase